LKTFHLFLVNEYIVIISYQNSIQNLTPKATENLINCYGDLTLSNLTFQISNQHPNSLFIKLLNHALKASSQKPAAISQ
jgi:hypothetical protein